MISIINMWINNNFFNTLLIYRDWTCSVFTSDSYINTLNVAKKKQYFLANDIIFYFWILLNIRPVERKRSKRPDYEVFWEKE